MICPKCEIDKPDDGFYPRGSGRSYSSCKECTKARNRERHTRPDVKAKKKAYNQNRSSENRDSVLAYGRAYYESKVGRAKTMMKSARRRSDKFSDTTDLTDKIILEMLETTSVCTVTGIPFDYKPSESTKKNPYAPSLDRIDSSRGYIRENVRLVIWQYNLMKGEISDDELVVICKAVVNRGEN